MLLDSDAQAFISTTEVFLMTQPSTNSSKVTAAAFSPFPDMLKRRATIRRRKAERSEILTKKRQEKE